MLSIFRGCRYFGLLALLLALMKKLLISFVPVRSFVIGLLFLFSIVSPKYSRAQGDDCNTALFLPSVANYCSTTGTYTNAGSTPSGFGTASCWAAAQTSDVWFSFIAIASDVNIIVSGLNSGGGTIEQPAVVIYSGNCAGTINEQVSSCNVAAPGTDLATSYTGGLVPGTTYFIRVSSTAVNTGSFSLCVNNFTPPLNPGADCNGASYLCDKSAVTNISFSGPGNDSYEGAGTCLDINPGLPIETNSVWYYWTCGTTGSLTFDINPIDPSEDIDWVLYSVGGGGNNPCGPLNEIRCNAASCLNALGSTGIDFGSVDLFEPAGCPPGSDAYCQFVNMVAGTTYVLQINNFTAAEGFTLSFGGTGTFLGPQPVINASATTICAGGTINFDGLQSQGFTALDWSFSSGSNPTTASGSGPHAVTFAAPGNYVAILNASAVGGCSSLTTMGITVTPAPQFSAGPPVSICGNGSAQLAATPGFASYLWTPAAGLSAVNISNPTASPAVTTNYTVVATDANGCSASDNVTVTVGNLTVNLGLGSTICNGGSVTLSGPPGFTSYLWTPGTGLSAVNISNPIANPAVTTTYTLVVTDANGCTGTDDITVTVGGPGVNLGADVTVCNGVSATLSAPAGFSSYQWTPATGLSAVNVANPIASPTVTTTYSVIVTDALGCTGTDTIIVNVGNLNISIRPDTTICEGTSITLPGPFGYTSYQWSPAAGLSAANVMNPVATPASTTTYSLVATDANGCTATGNVLLTVVGFTLTLSPDTGICPGDTVQLSSTPNLSAYSWSPVTGLNAANIPDPVFTGNTSTTYLLIATDINGCSSSGTISITVFDPPLADFIYTPESPSSFIPTVEFIDRSIGAADWYWSFGDSITSTVSNPSHSYSQPGIYTVSLEVTSNDGCTGRISRQLEYREEYSVWIPNAFSPNKDGNNDLFRAYGFNVTFEELSVFNRNGEKIFEGKTLDDGWDGRYLDRDAQEGLYVFMMRYRLTNGKQITETSHFSLIR